MVLQPLQGLSNSDHLTGLSSNINVATLTSSVSNFQDGRFRFPINQPTSIEPMRLKHQFDNQLHEQNLSSETHAGQPAVDSNLQELIMILSSKYGPMKAPLETGTPEYMKLVEILQQSSVIGRESSVEELSGGLKEICSYSKEDATNNIQNVETASLTEDNSCRNNQAKISSSEKNVEQLWQGSLQLSSSVTLSAVAIFKSGEKLVGNYWPDFIEVKGKVRLEAFEKYVQDLPRSRNRGLMVISISWNEGSSNIGLNGMKEVAKGYKKSSRVGFAQLLPGIDLYICPRSDPIITILAKYGFFKGMSVLDDKPDSMIGCVVWRKNRPINPVTNTSDGKNSPNLTQPQNSPPGFSSNHTEKKLSPENTGSSHHNEILTLPLTTVCADVDHDRGSSSSSSSPFKNSVSSDPGNLGLRKRPFEDDDLPEFDFGVACGKSTFGCKPLSSPKKLDDSRLTQLPLITNERGPPELHNKLPPEKNDGSYKQSLKKPKLFDDDDMPEWRPPELHNQLPLESTTSNFQNLPLFPRPPPLPPVPPPPRADNHSSFSYQPFRPPISSQPPVFARPPSQPLPQPPLPPQPPSHSSGRFQSNQVLWHQVPFPSSNGRHPQL
ncbi:hypothetical protein E3N88_41282 [Mikania micrantha]|uniref:Spen paralogue and orthologue SPOC C-terminal domain-containing protein n=1 Tax=Mikania micrantha TaxID=192012 RepID=A0A5N6LQ47_9ASTR|nr:hypothetical protein E3N88_41282 [Mikania micrantha]